MRIESTRSAGRTISATTFGSASTFARPTFIATIRGSIALNALFSSGAPNGVWSGEAGETVSFGRVPLASRRESNRRGRTLTPEPWFAPIDRALTMRFIDCFFISTR